MTLPLRGGAALSLEREQTGTLLVDPSAQAVPVTKNRFVRYLHDISIAARMGHEQPLVDEVSNQMARQLGQLSDCRDTAFRFACRFVDSYEPWNERGTSERLERSTILR